MTGQVLEQVLEQVPGQVMGHAAPSRPTPALAASPPDRAPRLRVVIVDDEPLSRRAMRQLLEARDDVVVLAEYASAVALDAPGSPALDAVDVAFVDVEMPGRSGLDLARALGDPGRGGRPPFVVVVTAHEEYALAAFDAGPVDYLTKPVAPARLARALARVYQRLAAVPAPATPDCALLDRAPLPPLLVRVGRRTIVVPWADVTLVAADGVYTTVHAAGQRYLVRRALDDLERDLAAAEFLRVHRSFLVRRTAIAEVRLGPRTRRRELVLTSGTVVPVSRRRQAVVAQMLRA